MSKVVLIQGTTLGADTGPFNIYHTSISPGNLLGTAGYTREQVIAGIYIPGVPDEASEFFLASAGTLCTNYSSATLQNSQPPASPPAPSASVVTAPILVSALQNTGATGITLTWTHPNTNIKEYRIFGSYNGALGPFTLIKTVPSGTFSAIDLEVINNTNHGYYIVAVQQVTNYTSVPSNIKTVYYSVDVTPPVAPSYILVEPNVTPGGEYLREITVTWPKSTSSDVAFYKLYRKQGTVGNFFELTTFMNGGPYQNTYNYVDYIVSYDLEYCYRVTCVDADGNESTPSSTDCAIVYHP